MKEDKFTNIFLPVSALLIFWYFLVLIVLLIDYLFTVVVICYRDEFASYIFRQYILPFVVITLFIDICISFNTGFIKNGKIIWVRKQIARNYVFSLYFWLDILAFVVVILQLILKNDFTVRFPFLNFLVFIKIVKAM